MTFSDTILENIIQGLDPEFNWPLLGKNSEMFTELIGYISELLSIMKLSTFSIYYKTLYLIQGK